MKKDKMHENVEVLKKIKWKNKITIVILNKKPGKYLQMEIDNKDNLVKISKLYELGVVSEEGEYIRRDSM